MEINAQTDKLKATIEANKRREVSELNMKKLIMEKELLELTSSKYHLGIGPTIPQSVSRSDFPKQNERKTWNEHPQVSFERLHYIDGFASGIIDHLKSQQILPQKHPSVHITNCHE